MLNDELEGVFGDGTRYSGIKIELLRDPRAAALQVLRTSDGLEAVSDRGPTAVSFAFPAALLKQQNYLVQLSGIRANAASELITTYAFRAVVQ